jgi:Tol biopolymer transport system component
MRRTIALTAAMLGLFTVLFVAPVDAKAPGSNGRIVFVSGPPGEDPSGAFTMNSDGTDLRALPGPAGFCYRWSPDGSKLATTVDSTYGARPATMNSDGTGVHVLDATTAIMNLACPAWSPDGTRLALEGFNDDDPSIVHGIYTVRSSDGGDLQFLTERGICPCDYSPDGTQLAFPAGEGQVGIIKTDGTGFRLITPRNFNGDGGLGWSPDGRWIVFNRPGSGNLYLVHPDGTGLQQVPLAGAGKDRAGAFNPGWSPDGTRIIFSMFTRASGQVDLYTANPDGTGLVRLTDTTDVDVMADWGPSTG